MEDDTVTVIIDNGSGRCKAGFSGMQGCDDSARSNFPSIVGRPHQVVETIGASKDSFVGDDAHWKAKKSPLSIKYPIQHGVVTDWEDMEAIWHHIFQKELRVLPEEHPVLVTEGTLTPRSNRERMMETMFETFKSPAFYVYNQAVLALCASGRTTGVVLNSGAGVTHAVPIYEGYTIPHATRRLDLAGHEITDYLRKMLAEQRHLSALIADQEVVRTIKHNLCYVALDFDQESNKTSRSSALLKTHELPDGQTIIVENERFWAPEALFQPSLVGLEATGAHETVYSSILACDSDLHTDLSKTILLSGGTTMYPGFEARLKKELLAIDNLE